MALRLDAEERECASRHGLSHDRAYRAAVIDLRERERRRRDSGEDASRPLTQVVDVRVRQRIEPAAAFGLVDVDERLGLASGTLPVEGPGLVVRLDDAPPDDAVEDPLRGGTPVDGRVQDRDLQDLVNGLWAAGAEAISINDVRLTALTAIRSAGDAVLVDFRLL